MLYICAKFCERYQSYRADSISILKITKGNNFAKNVGGVTIFNLCTSSGHALYFYQVLWNYPKRYQSYRADTISIRKITKGNNFAKNIGGVTVFNLCTSSGHALYCAKFREIISNGIKATKLTWMMNRWRTDGRTDTQKFGGYNIIPRHFFVAGHKKGNLQLCQNYRTISLISHSSKVMLNVILNRLKAQAEVIIAEEQAGFRAGRSTKEQIFNLRILCEKYLQHQQNQYHVFIDFNNAFDRVW